MKFTNFVDIGQKHTVIEATSEQRNTLKSKTGQSSVPNIWIKGKFVGGCNDGPEVTRIFIDI